MPSLTISIINFRTKDLTEKCLKSILDKKWKIDPEIVVVDNASGDGSSEYLKDKFPKVKFIENDKNAGFAAGHNLVLEKTKSDYTLILNSDTEVMEGSLDKLVEFMEGSDFGIGSATLVNNDGSFQPAGGDLPNLWPVFVWLAGLDDFLPGKEDLPSLHRKYKNYYKGGEVGWVGGTAMIIKKSTIDKIGLLDGKIFMYAEDVEYCLRAHKAGIKVGFTDQASIKHLGGASSEEPHLRQWLGEFKGLKYIYKKHYGAFEQLVLDVLILFFVGLRIIIFTLLGKINVAKTYVEVLKGF